MTNDNTLKDTRNLLKKHSQEHLLAFWEQLEVCEQQELLDQVNSLDFCEVDDWIAEYVKKGASGTVCDTFAPSPFYRAVPADRKQADMYAKAIESGKELISSGKVAAFVVAGGQGTRLGFDGPKGNFRISPIKEKSLFQIFAETIRAVSKKYQIACPWYIMTSPLNHNETKQIFHSNNYYGLDEKNVFIFQQGTMPNFSFDGKILMADKANISRSPDGHGGSLKALFVSGAIDDMKKRGVEYISYFQVDNPLINIFDPLFIGLHALDKAEMSSKGLVKTEAKERVGNFCLVDGKVTVIEYSDLPDELAEKRNADDSLVFNMGSIAIHIINVSFVEKLNCGGFSLPLHRAVKKIVHVDEKGELIEPSEPNGIKLESFIFDALPLASKSIILETERREEFGPVKNARGVDSAETAREMIIERAASWLESAGVNVPRKVDCSVDAIIEIAPSFALERKEIKTKLDKIPEIKPKNKIYLE